MNSVKTLQTTFYLIEPKEMQTIEISIAKFDAYIRIIQLLAKIPTKEIRIISKKLELSVGYTHELISELYEKKNRFELINRNPENFKYYFSVKDQLKRVFPKNIDKEVFENTIDLINDFLPQVYNANFIIPESIKRSKKLYFETNLSFNKLILYTILKPITFLDLDKKKVYIDGKIYNTLVGSYKIHEGAYYNSLSAMKLILAFLSNKVSDDLFIDQFP